MQSIKYEFLGTETNLYDILLYLLRTRRIKMAFLYNNYYVYGCWGIHRSIVYINVNLLYL